MSPEKTKKNPHEGHARLGQVASTAICGNDILSSVLYVSGIAITVAGIFAPLILLGIGLVLLLYKGVYREVVESLPVNGGAYNALLNGTSKKVAGTAGVLTILSYVATCVISGKTAVEYVHTLVELPVIPITIVVLIIFAALVISGVKDSAKVAMGIFFLHLVTLITFVALGIWYLSHNPTQFQLNWTGTQDLLKNQDLVTLLFLGFSASLLGVSGFESSANFVEEQQAGVFKKTLRNMTLGVVLFNPLVAFICLGLSSITQIHQFSDFLLADEAKIIGGNLFQYIVVTDAFLVLCGAVLTSFIGVSGLIHRMSLDEALPMWFSKQNSRGSYPRIVTVFFIFCVSILIMTGGKLTSLGGVYAISFLAVMSMFGLGNIILKVTRPDLKRQYHFPIIFVLLAFFATFLGLVGNIVLDVQNLVYFAIYFIPAITFVRLYMARDNIIAFMEKISTRSPLLNKIIRVIFKDFTKGKYIAFIHRPDRLYSVLKYIDNNETGRNAIIIHCKDSGDEINGAVWKELQEAVPLLPKVGVFQHLKLELQQIDQAFGADAINYVSKKFNIPKNRIFIGTIHGYHNFAYEELGGVRIVV